MLSQDMAGLSRTSNSLPSLNVEEERKFVFIACQLYGLPRLFHSAVFACVPDKSMGQERKEDG